MDHTADLIGSWGSLRKKLEHAACTSQEKLRKAVLREAIKLADGIKENITQGGSLANKPFVPNALSTIKQKKSSAPLIHHGDLRNAVAAHHLDRDRILVGIAGPSTSATKEPSASQPNNPNTQTAPKKPIADHVAQYARIHEFGAICTTPNGHTSVWIPARPFIRPMLEHTRNTRKKAWKAALKELATG